MKGNFTDSVQHTGNDQALFPGKANSFNRKIGSTGMMEELDAFRRVHRQNGTDSLSYYQQTGLLPI